MNLLVNIGWTDCQIEPLVSNEEYSAGGMENVRGYLENEEMGDNAFHGTAEISFPAPFEETKIGKIAQVTPFIFYDIARLITQQPLPGQTGILNSNGTGAGIRGAVDNSYMQYEIDWAIALQPD